MSLAGILVRIVATKKEEVAALEEQRQELKDRAYNCQRQTLDFKKALANDKHLSVISEVKKASPSAGIIDPNFDHRAIAKAYVEGGTDAMSILTDIDYFQGHPTYLQEIRQDQPNTPILRKDFIIDEIQIHEARIWGADAFLLIAAILTEEELRKFIQIGEELNLMPLVEVHDRQELEKSLKAGARVIGVNNRDLRDFSTNLNLTSELAPLVPEGIIFVGESGIKTTAEARHLQKSGCHAILVGETLMRHGIDNAGQAIADMQGNC